MWEGRDYSKRKKDVLAGENQKCLDKCKPKFKTKGKERKLSMARKREIGKHVIKVGMCDMDKSLKESLAFCRTKNLSLKV